MLKLRTAILIAACSVAGAACAQSATSPLNLKLSPQADIPPPAMSVGSAPAPSGTAATPPSHHAAPGIYYGDTSGRTGVGEQRVAAAPKCDDATYNQPQTHGSIGMGVMGGSHMSGNYQTGTVSMVKQLGSCEHPTGSVGFTISVGQGRVGGRRW